MIKTLLLIVGAFFLLFAAIPFCLYGIFNFGVFSLLLIGSAMIFLPRFWHKIAAIPHLRGFLVFSIFIFCTYCVLVSAAMYRQAYLKTPPETGAAAVIVLGSKINGDSPSLMLRRRLNIAHDYLMKNPQAVCIVTGGQGDDEDYPEAVVMKKYLVSAGVDPKRVITEDKSRNTRENLKFAAALIPAENAAPIIATDGFHQLRASIFANAEGIEAYGISSSTPWGLLPSYWVRDMLGVLVAWAQTA